MKEKIQKITRYLNPVSTLHLMSSAMYNILIAARGFSKSFTNGLKQAAKVQLMPRSLGLFTSPTYSMIYSKTLIPMKAAWEQHMGYKEGIHYVVGKAPPKHFEKPYHRPHRYENVVTFWNGRSILFGSFDRPEFISGSSFDDADHDEVYLTEKDDHDNFVIPTMRGTHPSFRDCEWHLRQTYTSSMPFRNQGDWLLDYFQKALQNPKMYSFIGWQPNAKIQMGDIRMNAQVLGMKAIEAMIAEMNPISAKIMLFNQKISNWGNLFYPVLNAKHWYTPKASNIIVVKSLNAIGKRDASWDEGPDDYNPDMPLNVSHDWGVFNCITIDQEYARELRVINTMHVHNPKIITDLADEFAEYYRHHKNKIVYQWGDRTGNNKQANSKKTNFEMFADRLREKKCGWRVILKKTGDIDQLERHLFINKLHTEEDPRLPRIRYNSKCTDFRIAMESAGMKDSKKDKGSETNANIKPEHATHYTDAHDYRLYHGLIHRTKSDSTGLHSTSL